MRLSHILAVAEAWSYPEQRPPAPRDWDAIMKTRRALEGLRPAMRDPETGKIYTGSSHQRAINSIPPSDDTGAWGRLSWAWHEATDDAGFVDRDGQFIPRREAARLWNVLTIEDVRDRLRALRGR